MSKVLKIAGEVVAIGALAVLTAGVGAGLAAGVSLGSAIGGSIIAFGTTVGLSLGTVALIGAGLTLAGGLLAKKPQVSPAQVERTKVSLQLDAPRKIVFGHTALATDLRYQETWGTSQEYVSQVLVVASHWCEAIEQVWLNDTLAWDIQLGSTGANAAYFFVAQHAQATSSSGYTSTWSNQWSSNAPFTGCATLYMSFRVQGIGAKASSPFASSIPTRVTIRGKGARMYDPRLDSTAGGSGLHRASDQTTWQWQAGSVEIGRNPALCLLFYLIGWRIQNPVGGGWKLAVGCGIPVDRIDLGSFMTAANLCDEQVLRADGSYEPRYRCDGMFSEADDPGSVITAIEGSMNGKLRDSAGRFALDVFHNDLAYPVLALSEDDVLDDFIWDAGGALHEQKNVVKGRYTDPSNASLYQLVDYPPVSLASIDGIDRIETFDLALCQSPSQAQRLARQRLQRYQYPGTFSGNFKARAWAVKDGDVVTFGFPVLGFAPGKLFRVTKATVQITGSVPLVLAEENAAIYAWDRDERAAVVAADPLAFNPLLQPIKLAIDDAARTAAWSQIADDNGGRAALLAQAAAAKSEADAALADLARIGSDGWLNAGSEKRQVVQDWTAISNEDALLNAQASALGVSAAALNTARASLATLLLSLSPYWSDTTQDSAINPTVWNGRWTDYYYAKFDLLNLIAKAAAQAAPTVNRVRFSQFESGLTGWRVRYLSTGITVTHYARETAGGLPIIYFDFTAPGSAAQASIGVDDPAFDFAVTPGETLSVGMGIESSGPIASQQLVLWFVNAAGAIFSPDSRTRTGAHGFAERFWFTSLVPAGAFRAFLEVYFTASGAGSVHTTITQPMVVAVPPVQVAEPAFVAGPNAADGADVTGLNTALDTLHVGGRAATDVLGEVDAAVSDGVLTPAEKQALIRDWNDLDQTFIALAAKAEALGIAGTEETAASDAVTALALYLGAISPAWNDPTVNSNVNGTALSSKWHDATGTVAALNAAINGQPGAAGAPGLNNATVYAYKRATSTPAGPSATATYTFASAALTGLSNGWSATIPSGSDPLYAIVATASAAGASDTIASSEWSSPVILAQNGSDGGDGAPGLNNAQVAIYRRAASTPGLPSSTATYTFSTGVISGLNNGWSATPPSGSDALWISVAVASSAGASDTIASGEWASPIIQAQNGANGSDGTNGSNGSNGTNGVNAKSVFIYQRATSTPSLPSATATFTFSTQALIGLNNGWQTTIPTGADPIYVSTASALSTSDTDTIGAGEWAAVTVLAQNGANGSNGADGSNGLNAKSLFLYQRSASTPSVPSATTTYTFATDSLTGVDNGWGRTIPAGTDPIWVTTASAASTTGTDTIASGEWATPAILAQNGANGSNGVSPSPTYGAINVNSTGTFNYPDAIPLTSGQTVNFSLVNFGAAYSATSGGPCTLSAEIRYSTNGFASYSVLDQQSISLSDGDSADLNPGNSYTASGPVTLNFRVVVSRSGGSGSLSIYNGAAQAG